MFRKIAFGLLVIATVFLALVTIASFTNFNDWWIRLWDYPRLAIFTIAGLLFLVSGFTLRGKRRWVIAGTLLAVTLWQGYRIHRYTVIAKPEVQFIEAGAQVPTDQCFSVLSLNVLQHNRQYGRTLDLIRRYDPDMVLLLETDQGWVDALKPVSTRYPHVRNVPIDNTYGLVFMTRLPTDELTVHRLIENDIPSIFARLRTPAGRRFGYIGLHPRPPQVGTDTQERDAEIAVGARIAAKAGLPVLAMGDFNDVAWSDTSELFKRVGTYLDPRIGRGFYATFPASLPAFRWPLDQIYFTEEFSIDRLEVLGEVGSDHLPIIAQMCLAPAVGERVNEEPEAIEGEDLKEANEIIEKGIRTEAREEVSGSTDGEREKRNREE